MADVNELVLCKTDYNNEMEFRNAVSEAVFLLLNANYKMSVRYDDKGLGIVVIEYYHADESYGGPILRWLEPEEAEKLGWG